MRLEPARRSVRAGVAFLDDNITLEDGVPVDPLKSSEEIGALPWPGWFWRWRRGEQGDDSAAFADANRFACFNPVEHTPKVVPQLSHGSRLHVQQECYTFCKMTTRPSPARRELQVSADTVPILPALYQPSRLPFGGGGCPRKPQTGLLETESRLRLPRAGDLGPDRDLHSSALPNRGMPPTCCTDRGRRYPGAQRQFHSMVCAPFPTVYIHKQAGAQHRTSIV